MHFRNRTQAAELLARRLAPWRNRHPVVLAIPRGGVPLGRVIADALGAPLDIVLVHKVTTPAWPELALAAVDECGHLTTPSGIAVELGVSTEALAELARSETARLAERRRWLFGDRPPLPVRSRVVIVVDDGIATGATMIAAVQTLRAAGAAHIVVAAPVASRSAVVLARAEADDVIVLDAPPGFDAVGSCYDDFSPVEDHEVARLLHADPPASAPV